MSAKQMKDLRERAKLTQTEMAAIMGLGKTAYADLEADDPDWKKFKPRHLLALERASMKLALERNDINLALPAVRRDALDLARLISAGPD
ncbi:helix-turn-helix transcriptional regulator [Brevundimonas vitis]|uniref:Helix-turn-helix transcriptional regulator n=1 Tax=Brevundimonas vitisensis TaxID=2800818 RepID=A0ABX7BJ01_9CAUL|nr:helix-turn-helix transcriptional regulator [Brevundimonas vitisensis]QQQ17531.1 helix-turn-helix transcriptional regulator [Brevundimonas vitisensis]